MEKVLGMKRTSACLSSGGRNPGSIFTSLMMACRKTNQIKEINAGTGMVIVLAVRLIILLT